MQKHLPPDQVVLKKSEDSLVKRSYGVSLGIAKPLDPEAIQREVDGWSGRRPRIQVSYRQGGQQGFVVSIGGLADGQRSESFLPGFKGGAPDKAFGQGSKQCGLRRRNGPGALWFWIETVNSGMIVQSPF